MDNQEQINEMFAVVNFRVGEFDKEKYFRDLRERTKHDEERGAAILTDPLELSN